MKKVILIILVAITIRLMFSCCKNVEHGFIWSAIYIYNTSPDTNIRLNDTCLIDQYRIKIVLDYQIYSSLNYNLGFSKTMAFVDCNPPSYLQDTSNYIKKIILTTNDSIDINHPKNSVINDLLLSTDYISPSYINWKPIEENIASFNEFERDGVYRYLYVKFKPDAIKSGWHSFNVSLVLSNGNKFSNSTNPIFLK